MKGPNKYTGDKKYIKSPFCSIISSHIVVSNSILVSISTSFEITQKSDQVYLQMVKNKAE